MASVHFRLAFVITTVLTQTSDLRPYISADRVYPSFGNVVSKAGDVDKDGIPDLVIGDPGFASEQLPPTFWIVSGKDGTVLQLVVLAEKRTTIYRVEGGTDLDGNGVPDFVIGAVPSRSPEFGSLFVVAGESGAILHSSEVCVPVSDVVDHRYKNWVRIVQDFNGDGLSDVATICPMHGDGADLLITPSGRKVEAPLQFHVKTEGGADIGGFVPIEDVDCDGAPDFALLIVGPVRGAAALRVYSTAKPDPIWERSFDPAWGTYGVLATPGDLDSDGVRELSVSFNSTVAVVSGRDGGLVYGIESPKRSDSASGFGQRLAPIGDIDHDGIPDFGLSEPDLWPSGRIHARSGVDGRGIWEGTGGFDEEVWHLGFQLAELGDIDGDRVSDLVAGSCGNMSGEAGVVRVLSGRDGSLLFQFARKGDDVVVTRRKAREKSSR